jgi:hypothetical protein
MHSLLEVILPPHLDIETAIATALKPFDENEDDDIRYKPFYDYYIIGGRYAGSKHQSLIGRDRIDKFVEGLAAKGTTVSNIRFGKQELQPASQAAEIDAMWREAFPESPLKVCPVFAHFDAQPEADDLGLQNVMKLQDTPAHHECSRVIFVGDFHAGEVEATYMLQRDFWNGVTWMETTWNGTIEHALAMFNHHLGKMGDEYRKANTPGPDWNVVTVDYHS